MNPLSSHHSLPTTLLTAALLTLSPLAAHAATTFTSRDAFNAATTTLTTTSNDFESLVGTPGFPDNYPGGGGYTTNSSSGIIVDHATFVGRIGLYDYETSILHSSVAGGLYSLDGDYSLLLGRESAIVTFDTDVFAFGFEFRLDRNLRTDLPFASVKMAALFRFEDSSMDVYDLITPTNDSSFFGAYSASAIRSIEFFCEQLPEYYNGPRTPYFLLDNVVSGTVSAVPEPSQSIASSLVAGFALTIISRRNRKKATATI